MPGRQVQAVIAEHVLGPVTASERLGAVTLHRHQRDGANRALHLLRVFHGALVADDVGMGKTFLALAVARDFRQPLVVAPAALRDAWARASGRAGVTVAFRSMESLARTAHHDRPHDLVVIDEAHHLRNPATKRFNAARGLCASVPVLLLTATPIQNRVADLRVVMSLFLGERAHALSTSELATMVVRRDAGDVEDSGLALPAAESPRWLQPTNDVDCLERLIALPAPVPPADSGDGGTLLTYTLVRQWASSRAALVGALRRRVARALALEDALSHGRLPTRRELAAWCFADGAQQMAFAFMASALHAPPERILDHVRAHRLAVSELLRWLASTPDPDAARATRLQTVAADNPGRRLVVFSEFAESVDALYRRLRPAVRVAMMTHAGGRIAGGRMTRADLLSRFVPGARASMPERERIDVLLTTDVLSEGVDLHDASVVVHLDLPWNPARLAQRVGRVRRIGSPEASVIVYAMAPPAPAERMLELEGRLRRKLSAAAHTVGVSGEVLPGFATAGSDSCTSINQDLVSVLAPWRQAGPPQHEPVCGAVRSTCRGFIACVRLNGRVRLVGGVDSVTDEPAALAALARCAEDADTSVDALELAVAESAMAAWLLRHGTLSVVDLPERRVARSRRALLQRVEYVSRRIPRHARPAATPMLVAARTVAAASLSAGAEQVLAELTHSSLSDLAWLQAIGEFATLHARPNKSAVSIEALLLLRIDSTPPDRARSQR